MKATEVTAGLAESNGSLLPGLWRDSLHVTCRMTDCTPGSAPGPTLSNEYGKTLPFSQENSLCMGNRKFHLTRLTFTTLIRYVVKFKIQNIQFMQRMRLYHFNCQLTARQTSLLGYDQKSLELVFTGIRCKYCFCISKQTKCYRKEILCS